MTPACFLIHGWGMNRHVWPQGIAALDNTRLIDLPGYGQSSQTPQIPDSAQNFTDSARALADSLPAGSILCGWSLGALLAMQAALFSPRRVAGLILIGATPCFVQRDGWSESQPASLLEEFAAAVAADSPAAIKRFVALFNQGDTKARAIGREIARNVLPMLPPTATLLAGLDWLREADLRERVREIACPVLLIHGEHDPLMPLAAARWLGEHLPRARLKVFPEAAHTPFLNDPEAFIRLAGDFLHAVRTDQTARP